MAARAKIKKIHLSDSVQKMFKLSCPLFSNCGSVVENGLHYDLLTYCSGE